MNKSTKLILVSDKTELTNGIRFHVILKSQCQLVYVSVRYQLLAETFRKIFLAISFAERLKVCANGFLFTSINDHVSLYFAEFIHCKHSFNHMGLIR